MAGEITEDDTNMWFADENPSGSGFSGQSSNSINIQNPNKQGGSYAPNYKKNIQRSDDNVKAISSNNTDKK